jgi:hypothetical protein
MTTVTNASRDKPFHQQNQIHCIAITMGLSRGEAPGAQQYADIGRQKQIKQQARNQSERL